MFRDKKSVERPADEKKVSLKNHTDRIILLFLIVVITIFFVLAGVIVWLLIGYV